jgi:hypothetical protein
MFASFSKADVDSPTGYIASTGSEEGYSSVTQILTLALQFSVSVNE